MKFKKSKLVIGIAILILNINLFPFTDVQGWDPTDISMVDSCSIPTDFSPYGLTWNGTHYCALVIQSPSGLYFYTRSGLLTKFVSLPFTPSTFPGLDFDGKYYWSIDSNHKVIKFDPFNGIIVEQFSLNFEPYGGLVLDGESLWCLDGIHYKVYKINLSTHSIVDSFQLPYSQQSFGLEYIEGYLWVTTQGAFDSDKYIYRIDPNTHEHDIVYRITDSTFTHGSTYDEEYLWIISANTNTMQAYDIYNPKEDNDGDGLTNEEEDAYMTNPNEADTDGDNLGDGVEIRLNLDPNNWDSDGDGIGDGLEFIANFGGDSSAHCLPEGFIRMTIQWEDSFAIITTNSTMLSTSFDRTKNELEFNVEGPIGTSSLCNVTFPQSLISDINDIKVKLDNTQIAFTYTISDNMVKISFIHTNSEHTIKISTSGSEIITGYPLWIVFGILFVFITLIIKRKQKLKF